MLLIILLVLLILALAGGYTVHNWIYTLAVVLLVLILLDVLGVI